MELNVLSSSSSNSDSDDSDNGYMQRQPRVFESRINFHINYFTDFAFKEKFRISKESAEYILNRIGANLQHQTLRNYALLPHQQLLCALHWLGSGCQYHVCGDAHGLSKSSVHRCIKKVYTVLVQILLGEEVKWPTENVHCIPQRFMGAANFPRVAGIVDGSLIQMDAPRENEGSYVDRDGNHSINAMFVCGPNLEFFYASARWPGSVHDARVLRNSSLALRWNNGWRPFPNAILLGDSGYGLKPWLITPVLPVAIPRTPATVRFLRSLKSTRRMIENALGILKEKFPCLNYLRVQPIIACHVILSCVILHNIEKRLGSITYEPYNNYASQACHARICYVRDVEKALNPKKKFSTLLDNFSIDNVLCVHNVSKSLKMMCSTNMIIVNIANTIFKCYSHLAATNADHLLSAE